MLQAPRVVRAEGLAAADHFVEQDSKSPRIGMQIAVAALQALRRQVRGAAEVVSGHLAAQGQGFRGAKVQDFDAIARHKPDIARLEVVVQQHATRRGVRLKPIRFLQELTELTRDRDGAFPGQRPAVDRLRQVLSLDVFHRNVEIVGGES